MYKNHAQKILTRINTVTGIPYSNDSTIFGEALLYQDLSFSASSPDTIKGPLKLHD